MRLSLEAKRIIRAKEKFVEVLACPGSGKTTVLAYLCQYLISQGMNPAEILILSFTNASVDNVRARLKCTFQ